MTMDNANLLLVTTSLSKGGAESQLVLLAKLLKRHTDYNPRVIALNRGGYWEEELKREEIPYAVLNIKLAHKSLIAELFHVARWARSQRDGTYRLVLSFMYWSNLFGLYIARILGAKHISSVRNRDQFLTKPPLKKSFFEKIDTLLLNASDAVVFNSRNVMNRYSPIIRTPSKCRVIYNGLLDESFASDIPLPPEQDKLFKRFEYTILNVAHLKRKKGIDVLIRAARKVLNERKDVVFVNVGKVVETEYAEQIRRDLEALELDGNFKFLGPVENVSPYYSRADVYVHPSRSEGYSNAIIEAGIHRLPIVATDVDGNREAIDDGYDGYLVAAEDANMLSEKLLILLEDKNLRFEMGKRISDKMSELHQPGKMLSSYKELFRDLLA